MRGDHRGGENLRILRIVDNVLQILQYYSTKYAIHITHQNIKYTIRNNEKTTLGTNLFLTSYTIYYLFRIGTETRTLSMKVEIFLEYSRITPALCVVLYHGELGKSLTEIVSNHSVLFISLSKQKTGLGILTIH